MYHSRIVLSVGGSVWYMIRNLRCTVTIDSFLANSKTQNAFLFTMNAIFRRDYPLAVEPASTPRPVLQKKKTWRDSLPIDMLLSAVSVLVVAQSSSEIPEGLMNNPVYLYLLNVFGFQHVYTFKGQFHKKLSGLTADTSFVDLFVRLFVAGKWRRLLVCRI